MSELFGERIGKGPKGTVLLHGFLGQGRNLRTLANRWAEQDPSGSILLLDLPGHGDSRPLNGNETLATVASSVLDAAKEAGLSLPLGWVGHSLGGRVALSAIAVDLVAVSSISML